MSISVGNSHSEDQLMHTFLDNFHQGRKYSDQIASHQAELRIEGKNYRSKIIEHIILTD